MIRKKLALGLLGGVLVVVVGLLVVGRDWGSETLSYEFGACSGKKTDSINLSQSGSSLLFTQVLNTYCGAEDAIVITYKRTGDSIEVRETFDADVVSKCICPQEIEGQVADLEPGRYWVKFVFDNRYTGEVKTLAEEEFELR
jgi:hypothetical protein